MSTTQSNASESGPKILRHFDFIYASWDSTDNVLRALAMSLLYHHDFRASFLTSLGLEPPAGSPVAGEAP
ncbi:MAG TPA: hypothetical protein DCE41_34535, partial [Cytophagales bacterium]|nr:hypothetical protein [Cytophagales bacterium]